MYMEVTHFRFKKTPELKSENFQCMTYEKCQNAFRGFIHIEGNYYAYMKGDKMGHRAEIS